MSVQKTEIREHIEWTNMRWNNATDIYKARILLVGDSIVMGHGGFVHDILKDKYCVDYFATAKCLSDINYMKELNCMLVSHEYDLVIFNNGLHGFDISDEAYEENLKEILFDLSHRVKKLVWRNSTPMREEGNLVKFNSQRTPTILKRNAFAARVAKELGIPLLDLYTPMSEHIEYFLNDAVHYNDIGKKIQAQIIVEFIKEILKV